MSGTGRVLFVIDELEVGGAQRQVLLLGRAMLATDHEVAVAYFREAGAVLVSEFEEAGLRIILVEKRRRLDAGFFRQLRRLLRDEHDSLVLGFGYTANLWTRLATAGSPRPLIVSCVRDHHYLPDPGWPVSAGLAWLERWLSRRSLEVVANSAAAARYLLDRKVVPESKLLVIPNGVDPGVFAGRLEARKQLAAACPGLGTAPLIGTLGRLVPVKDQATFVRAARVVADSEMGARFVIGGEGPERLRLESLRDELGLRQQLTLPGRLSGTRCLAGFDVAVLSSVAEGMPNFLMEAMAAGVPVVATAVGAVPDLLDGGRLGSMVPAADPAALANAVIDVIRRPTEARARAEEARRQVCALRPSDVAQRYLDLFATRVR